MLDKIKLLLGITDNSKDELINLLIQSAKDELVLFCRNTYSDDMEGVVIDMCVFKYNSLDHTGLTGESYNGASFSYQTDYPPSILKRMRRYCKLRCF